MTGGQRRVLVGLRSVGKDEAARFGTQSFES